MAGTVSYINVYMNDLSENEYMMKDFFRRNNKGLVIGLSVALFLSTAAYLAYTLVKGFEAMLLVIYILWFIVCVAGMFFHRFQTRSSLKKLRDVYGDRKYENSCTFAREMIRVKEFGAQTQIPYEKIRKYIAMDGYYAFLVAGGSAIVIKKGCFTKGDEKDFLKFMKSKCPKVRMPAILEDISDI